MKLADALVHLLQSDGVGVPHRSAAIGGEAVTVAIDDVDVQGSKGHSFFQDLRSHVDQGIDAAIDHLRGRDLSLWYSRLDRSLVHEVVNFRIWIGAPILVVLVPPGASLLPEAAHLAQPIFGQRLAHARRFEMAVLLANSPSDVEAREIARGQRTHGHAEVVQRLIHFLDACALLHQELRLAPVGMEHAVPNEATAVAHHHADLAQPLGKLHAAGDHLLAGGFAAHDFQKPHHIRRAEEMGPDDRFWARGSGRDFVDVEGGGIGGKDGARFAKLVKHGEDFLLQRHALEYGLDHHVHCAKFVVVKNRFDQLQALLNELLCEAPALHRIRVVLLNVGHAAIEQRLVHLLEQHRNSGVSEHHGNAAAHGARAEHRDRVHRDRGRVFGNIGDFANLALAEEQVNERLRLIGEEAIVEQLSARFCSLLRTGAWFQPRLRQWRRAERSGRAAFCGSSRGPLRKWPRWPTASPSFSCALAGLRGRLSGNFASESNRTRQQVSIAEPVNDPKLQCLLGADRGAFSAHRDGFFRSGQAGQTLSSARAWNNSELHFRLTELRIGRSHAVMGRHRQLQAATQSAPMNRRDDGLRAVLQMAEQRQQALAPGPLAGCHLAEFLDVRPCDKSPAAADQHDGIDGAVLADLRNRLFNPLWNSRTQGIYRRIVDGDYCNVVCIRKLNQFVHSMNTYPLEFCCC